MNCNNCNTKLVKRQKKFCSLKCVALYKTNNGLTNNKWSMKYNNCILCKSTNNKHQAKGLCTKCYSKTKEKNLEKERLRAKMWREQNKDKVSLNNKRYKIQNKDKYKETTKEYRKTLDYKISKSNSAHKRRVKMKQVKTDITTKWLRDLWIKTTHCELCGKELEDNTSYPNGRHLDHIVPLLADHGRGLHVRSNVRYICALCNVTR